MEGLLVSPEQAKGLIDQCALIDETGLLALATKQASLAATAWEAGALGATTASVENWPELVLWSCLGKTKWAWQMRKIACEKMAQGCPKEYSVILVLNQNGCLREPKRSDALAALSLCNDPVSLCSLVADERVSLAEPYGIVMPRLPLPLDVVPVIGLVTGGNASFDFDAVMHEESGGFTSWELRLGGSTEAHVSESLGDRP